VVTLKEKLKHEELPPTPSQLVKPVIITKKAPTKHKIEKEDTPIKEGDSVYMIETQVVGEVTQLKGQDITIAFNSISLKTTVDKVLKISKKEARAASRGTVSKMDGSTISEVMNSKISQFTQTLDIRGKRADEAIEELELYLDEALLINIKQVKILHGKGNGILRHVIRQYLHKRKEVKSFHDEVLELGGAGITVVRL